MKRLVPLMCLMLGMCATVPVSCDTARVAAQLATAAMARMCPMTVR